MFEQGKRRRRKRRGFNFNYRQHFLLQSLITLGISVKGFIGAVGLLSISLFRPMLGSRRRPKSEQSTVICSHTFHSLKTSTYLCVTHTHTDSLEGFCVGTVCWMYISAAEMSRWWWWSGGGGRDVSESCNMLQAASFALMPLRKAALCSLSSHTSAAQVLCGAWDDPMCLQLEGKTMHRRAVSYNFYYHLICTLSCCTRLPVCCCFFLAFVFQF